MAAGTREVRTLIHLPPAVRRGVPFEVRATIAHPMETGYRNDALGQRLPRDILRRFECRLDGELVLAADLHPAIAANPFIAFSLVAETGGTLTLTWTGDQGFAHTERVALNVT